MNNRRLPTPSNACHIPTVATSPIRPQINDRRLGRARDIETESTSVNQMDENSTFASGAPRNKMRQSVKRTSEPSSPCVNAEKSDDSPGNKSAKLSSSERSAGDTDTTPSRGGGDADLDVSGVGPPSPKLLVTSETLGSASASCDRPVGASEQVQNRTPSAAAGEVPTSRDAARSSVP